MFAATLAMGIAGEVAAEEVTLTSNDGLISLSGELLEFDGETYRINTSVGELQITASAVTCQGPGCPETTSEFLVAGSSAMGAGFMSELIEGYAFSRDVDALREVGAGDGVQVVRLTREDGFDLASITVDATGASNAFDSLLSGDAAIAMSSRQVDGRDVDRFIGAGLPDLSEPSREKIVALDGLLMVVAPDNPLTSISFEQAYGVFTGRIDNWSDLGGPDAAINVYLPDAALGEFEMLDAAILRPRGGRPSPNAQRFVSNETLSDAVSRDPFGIGVTGFAFERNARALPIQLECGLISQPDAFSIKTEEYPLSRRLFMYTSGAVIPEHAQGLLDYALSDAGQEDISRAGFVDQRVAARGIDRQGLRIATALTDPQAEFSLNQMRDFVNEVLSAERLSATFRFNAGSSLLDNKAQSDVQRMAQFFKRPEFSDYEFLLIGFTDSVGRADLNNLLSVRRAEQVRDAILDAAGGGLDPQKVQAIGYGELSPLGCNETFEGRGINRRVEVWARPRA